VPIKFPNPGLLDGAKGKFTEVVKLTNLTFWYPTPDEAAAAAAANAAAAERSTAAAANANGGRRPPAAAAEPAPTLSAASVAALTAPTPVAAAGTGAAASERKIILSEVSGYVNLKSRIAILGANGAGKSTLMQLLIGELELPEDTETSDAAKATAAGGDAKFGSVYRHHNLRVAYIAQHSMHHLEDNLEDTAIACVPNACIRGGGACSPLHTGARTHAHTRTHTHIT
jgi:ATPase subunit of ABC transporter with duplicated ATPase domains